MFTTFQLIQVVYAVTICSSIWAALSHRFNDGFLGKAALAVASLAGYVGLIRPERHYLLLIVLVGLLFAIIRHLAIINHWFEGRK